jgi:hypothetical protein
VLANPTVGLSTNASEVAAITSGRVILFVFMVNHDTSRGEHITVFCDEASDILILFDGSGDTSNRLSGQSESSFCVRGTKKTSAAGSTTSEVMTINETVRELI